MSAMTSATPSKPPPMGGAPQTTPLFPAAPSGWIAIAAAGIGMGSWIVLPIIGAVFRDEYPVTDTVVMPIIGLALTVLAAIVNVLALWLGKQRSLANILATVLTVSASLFFGVFVIGEGLGGA